MLLRRLPRCFARPSSSSSSTAFIEKEPAPLYSAPSVPHQFVVVHPKIRWGPNSPSVLRDANLQVEEAITLVGTIPSFRVANSVIVGTDYNTKKARIWGEGRLEELVNLKEKSRATALMINVDRLTPVQQSELHAVFHCPIYDRFNIVLSIFQMFAPDELARLQIALARIPYIKQRLNRLRTESHSVLLPGIDESFGGINEEDLRMREQWLRKRLGEAIEKEKHERMKHSMRGSMVAVVGYTNAGKTSLIKRLTASSALRPLNRLFATLNTSEHSARLPSGRLLTLVDTIGFLYDLPMDLLAAFEATLSHLKEAGVVVHVRDVSNPDWRAQDEEVRQTLQKMGVDEERSVLTVDNKIDRCSPSSVAESGGGSMRISCKTGEGVKELVEEIDQRVRVLTGCKRRSLRLPFSSPSIQWLYSEGFVVDEPTAEEDRLHFIVHMTDDEFERFKKFSQEQRRRKA